MLEIVLEQHELSHEGAMREQETVSKQRPVQESWQKDAKRVQETEAKQQKSFHENAQKVQETLVKSHSVSSSLLAWQVCAQEKLPVYVSSNRLRLSRQTAVVDKPTFEALHTVIFATLYRDVKQWSAVARRGAAFPAAKIAGLLR